jgi:hypothetical protein
MTQPDVTPSGERTEKQRQRRYWLVMVGPVLVALLVGFAFNALHGLEDISAGRMSPARAWIGVFIAAVLLPVTAALHHRVADEQEVQAILWSTHLAFLFIAMFGGHGGFSARLHWFHRWTS